MPITIKDIARETQVSHTTVSRALNGNPLISPETTERIRQKAASLGYLPSAAARTLKTNRSRVLGVMIHSVDDPFFGEILQGIEEVAQASGYSLFVAASQDGHHMREQAIVKAMVERRVDGLVICSTPVGAEQSRRLAAFGVPLVVVNNQAVEEYCCSIYHDDVDGSRQVTRHLLELGHRRIAYLGNALAGRSTQDRLAGFRQEMEAAGLPIPQGYLHQASGGRPADGLAALQHFLELEPRPTALLCYNDMLAVGVLQGLRAAGIRVPEQMSVTGFDNILFSAYTNPALTTLDQPKRSIGVEAARLVLGLLDDPQEGRSDPKIIRLKGSLLVRESTAAPSGE